jgi:hypothetical protein
LRGHAETPALRQTFNALLDRVDALNAEADGLPAHTKSRRLRLETAVIVGLAKRLAKRLRHGDPLATRVKLRKLDAAASMITALRFLP